MAVGTMVARLAVDMDSGRFRANAANSPSNEKGIDLYTPDQDEPVLSLEPGKTLRAEHLAVFIPWERDALLDMRDDKKSGWTAAMKRDKPSKDDPTGPPRKGYEWDHFSVSMTEGMSAYFKDDAKAEERDRYRKAIMEGLRNVQVDRRGEVFEARKSMVVTNWHMDTPNAHFNVYLHRHPISVDNKFVAPAERVTANDELARMQTRINEALERHGFGPEFHVEIEAGATMSKTKTAERVQEQNQRISESWTKPSPEATQEPQPAQEDPRKVVDEQIKAEGGEPLLSPTSKPLSDITPDALRFSQTADMKFARAATIEEQIQALKLEAQAEIAQGVALQHAAAVHVQNDALKVENGKLLDNIETLKIEKGEIQEELNATKEELTESQRLYAELEEIAKEQSQDLDAANTQVEALTQTVEVQSKDIEALTADKASLAGQLTKTEHKLGVANRSIHDLQVMVEEADKDRVAAQDLVKEKDVEIEALTADLTDAKMTIEAQAGEISLLTTEISTVRELAQVQEKALGEAKNQLMQAQAERDMAKGQAEKLAEENGRLKDGMTDMRLELATANARAEALDARLVAAEQARDMMKDNLEAQKALNASQAQALEGKDKTIADLEAKLAAMEARMQEQQQGQELERPQASKALHEVLSNRLRVVVVTQVREPDYPALAGKDKNGDDVWVTQNKETQVTAYAVTSAKTGEIKSIAGEEKGQTIIKDQLETRNREKEQERAQAQARERESRGGGGMER